MGNTKIEWATKVWNPLTGCTPVTAGCRNCYARRMAMRLAGRYGYPAAPHEFDVTLHPERLEEPLQWRNPQRVFVCSMGDLFHEAVSNDLIDRIFAVMQLATWHRFILLTKRPKRMCDYINGLFDRKRRALHQGTALCRYDGQVHSGSISDEAQGGLSNLLSEDLEAYLIWPLPNIWLGVSVSNQDDADRFIPELLATPAAVRFVSAEPLLGLIDLTEVPMPDGGGLDLVIAGCETGPSARPAELDWFREFRDHCRDANVPLFVKQININGKVSKNLLDWPEDLRMRQFPS